MPFSEDVMKCVYECLYLSVAGLLVGSLRKGKRIKKQVSLVGRNSRIDRNLLGRIIKPMVYITGLTNLLVAIERVMYFMIYGEVGLLRIDFASSLPSLITYPSFMYNFLFCAYLATMPTKKKTTPVILLYLVVAAVKLAYGSRSDFIIGLLFIAMYYVVRDRIAKNAVDLVLKEKWISTKERIAMIAAIPAMMVLAVFIQAYRTGNTFDPASLLDIFLDFFSTQGVSIHIIGYGEQYIDELPQPNFIYLFGNTVSFLKTNPLSRLLFSTTTYAVNTRERAMFGSSFAQAISYLVNETSYLSGYGAGSSYVAEAYVGYGLVGVFIVNAVLARIIHWINSYQYQSYWGSVIVLLYIQSLFFMPRAGFDDFVGEFTSLSHLIVIFAIVFIYQTLRKRRGDCRQ